ncbi:MAG: tetratricopeptide repeat protein [Gammaproteobacteria bacterium]|nr:tetratricopeptide repeat protein [Gammaproteobacteria bacterium]
MKFGLLVVVVVLLCAIGANFLLQDPGSVVITFRGKIIEMSVIVLAVLVVLLFGAIWLAAKLLDAPRKLGEAAGRYRAGRAGARLTRGVIEVAEGNFAKGERMLARSAGNSEAPLLNYLQAARAAHLLGQDERRDTWLKQAYENLPGAANAVLLTQAELQLDQKQYEQALATLRRIEESSPNHSRALTLLGRTYYRLGDWQQLAELLPRIRKHGRIDSATLEQWSVTVYREQLTKSSGVAALDETWQKVPKDLRQNVDIQEAWFTNLLRAGLHERAEKELVAELKRAWHAPLVRIYGRVEGNDPVRQLRRAEDWLSGHPEDPDLLLTAARLCLRNELWGKARSYLETVIALRPSPDAYSEYGRLLKRLGEDEAAAEAFRDGLGLVSGENLAAIPHLGPDAGASP